ncbi:MAG: pyridoxamine 5'-phosphate oxidase family protein, partial [Microlunatus sp.]|nr:pyridoxamine 5'-phosphate oxidase family protein [Microlunatus sp.]
CRRLLASESVGRISWASSSGQLILPVTYVYLDQIIGFRTTPDGTLAELARPTQVAFEVDSLDSRRNEAVSVVVQGVTRAAERDGRTPEWTEDVVPWGGGRRPLAIEIEITKITGRRIQRGPDRG